MSKLDAGAVARAAGTVVVRTVGGMGLGALLGGVGFAIERAAGLLDATGWLDAALWVLLPVYVVVGATVLGILGALAAVRRVATTLLVDSGTLRRAVERGLERVRKSDTAHPAADGDAAGETIEAPPGWLGARLGAIGRTTSRAVVTRLRATAAPEAETAATIDATARLVIDEWGETTTYLAAAALVVVLAAPPLVLALS